MNYEASQNVAANPQFNTYFSFVQASFSYISCMYSVDTHIRARPLPLITELRSSWVFRHHRLRHFLKVWPIALLAESWGTAMLAGSLPNSPKFTNEKAYWCRLNANGNGLIGTVVPPTQSYGFYGSRKTTRVSTCSAFESMVTVFNCVGVLCCWAGNRRWLFSRALFAVSLLATFISLKSALFIATAAADVHICGWSLAYPSLSPARSIPIRSSAVAVVNVLVSPYRCTRIYDRRFCTTK